MPEYCYPDNPVRLACLIHAASVRSEPESNSQKKDFEFRPGPLTQTSLYSASLPNLLLVREAKDAPQASVFKDRRYPPFEGQRVHSISFSHPAAQGGILKNFYAPDYCNITTLSAI